MLDVNELDLWNQPDEGDPIVWLREHLEEIALMYPTFEEQREYYSRFNSVEDALARVREKIAEKKMKQRESAAK